MWFQRWLHLSGVDFHLRSQINLWLIRRGLYVNIEAGQIEFLGFYTDYEECRAVVYRMGILTAKQYESRRHADPRLPPDPSLIYKEFKGWKSFCEQKERYNTFEECKVAARALNITTQREYLRRRREDPKLPQNPEQIFSEEFLGWEEFLGIGGVPYETYEEASAAAVRLGCTNKAYYRQRRKEDPRLVASPMAHYSQHWKGWDHFLKRGAYAEVRVHVSALDAVTEFNDVRAPIGKATRTPVPRLRPGLVAIEFMSLNDAKRLMKERGVVLQREYRELLAEFPNLPPDPMTHYGDAFVNWDVFLGRPEIYKTFEECQKAAQALGIVGWRDYMLRRHEDPRLPSEPQQFPEFLTWEHFLGKADIPYPTYEEASTAARNLGITSRDIYTRRRKEDPRLVASPQRQYPNEWKGWGEFLQATVKRKPKSAALFAQYYATYEEFVVAARKHDFRNQADYKKRCVIDPKLPKNPVCVYADKWVGWGLALKGEEGFKPLDWKVCKKIALAYRFTGPTDYAERYKVDPRLPADPVKKYPGFPGWKVFLLPEEIVSLDDLKHAVKVLKLKSCDEYIEACKTISILPGDPEVVFALAWVDWYDLLGKITPYSYDEVQQIFQASGCKTWDDVSKRVRELNDPRIPNVNHFPKIYSQWSNVYDFLGGELPYTLEYVTKATAGWVEDVKRFIKHKQKKGTVESSICRFLRHFVEPHGLGSNVIEFMLLDKINVRQYEEFLCSMQSPNTARLVWSYVHEFLEDALRVHFTEEDEDTGDVYRVVGAANPLAAAEFDGYKSSPSESVKPVLAFHFVNSIRDWIVPEGAKTLGDLKALHGFDSDYHKVPASVIDFDDPNCVWRKTGNDYYLWYPGHWIALLALVSVPARGRQIMYNDSGEADEYIAELVDGKLVWTLNTRPMATPGVQQAFVTNTDGGWGMHFTSNKTDANGEGYSVPWIPEQLAYWLVVLRRWQEKYNPVTAPTKWTECQSRCNFSHADLAKKGQNVFLFRALNENQPPLFNDHMKKRLWAALYHIQPDDLELAQYRGNPENPQERIVLGRYSSKFTPHSMRVSLITAYIMDGGMDPTVLMKVVGHASIVMTIYYAKLTTAHVRHIMTEVEKRAQLNEARDLQIMIEQREVEKLRPLLVSSTAEALDMLLSERAGTQLVRDYGICPYAGSRCHDGGAAHKGKYWLPVASGHLGEQNCPRCRHLVTGPVFLGGMTALWNELSLNVRLQYDQYADLERRIAKYRQRLDEIRYERFDQIGVKDFDDTEKNRIGVAMRKLASEVETVAKKMDMYLCDMQALTKLIEKSRIVLNSQAEAEGASEGQGLQLIVSDKSEVQVGFEETSLFQQLHEVCVNATIYDSVSAVMATPRRSQMIDRMTLSNGIRPVMFELSEDEQLKLGNQIVEFFKRRLSSSERIDQLINGDIKLEDLHGLEEITHREYADLLSSEPLLGLSYAGPTAVPSGAFDVEVLV